MMERKIALARQMRRNMTPPEFLLWERLKDRSSGLVFKRQQAIGPYILDFYCRKARLAIEVDGGHHGYDAHRARDEIRDDWFVTNALRPIVFQPQQFLKIRMKSLTVFGFWHWKEAASKIPHHHDRKRSRSPSPASGEV